MSDLKIFKDLAEFLREDMGRFLLFGHDFWPHEHSDYSEYSTELLTYNYYECSKCLLRVEYYRKYIIMFEENAGIEIENEKLLSEHMPSCEKRCNEIIIKNIIE